MDARGTQRRPGLRELGLRIGEIATGPVNAITDAGEVRVGHVTVVRDEAPPPDGRGVARTGATAIVPRAPETVLAAPLPAGAPVLNGAGEMTGFLQVSEWGVIETPVYLTATMAVGRVFDGAVAAAAEADPAVRRVVRRGPARPRRAMRAGAAARRRAGPPRRPWSPRAVSARRAG